MNAVDILKYGHLTFQGSMARVPVAAWNTGGVCGVWSVKQIIAHIATYEELLVEILGSFLGSEESSRLERFLQLGPPFNDVTVAERAILSPEETLAEYQRHHAQVMGLIPQLPGELLRRPGTLPWYGAEYALDDYLVYQFYGHKREHSAQIAVYADVVEKQEVSSESA